MSEAAYVVYITGTGEIVRNFYGDTASAAAQAGSGESVLAGSGDPAEKYITGGVITTRPALTGVATWDTLAIDADGVDAATLGSGLPNPTAVYVVPRTAEAIEHSATVTDGSLVFKTTVVGTFEITAVAFPYKNYTVEVVAT